MHHCHANDCQTSTRPELFMCARHWRMVPKPLQEAIWRTYRERGGQHGNIRYLPYHEACAEAVEFVARAEGKPPANQYRRFVERERARPKLAPLPVTTEQARDQETGRNGGMKRQGLA